MSALNKAECGRYLLFKMMWATNTVLPVIAAAITSKTSKSKLPTHIEVYADKYGLAKDSVILLEQIRTIDKTRLKEKMGHLDDYVMNQVNDAITVSFGLELTAPRQEFIG